MGNLDKQKKKKKKEKKKKRKRKGKLQLLENRENPNTWVGGLANYTLANYT